MQVNHLSHLTEEKHSLSLIIIVDLHSPAQSIDDKDL